MSYITDITKNSPFFGKLKNGDVLLSVNGRKINDILDYMYHTAADDVSFCVLRDGKEVTVKVKCGAGGKFFGSVTNKEISDKLLELGFDVDKKKISLQSNVKTCGRYPVTIKISPEETAKITAIIVAEN